MPATPKKNGLSQMNNIVNKDKGNQTSIHYENAEAPQSSINIKLNNVSNINRIQREVIVPIKKRDFTLFFED